MATDPSQTSTTIPPSAVALVTPDIVQKVIEITRQIFPGSVSLECSHDPEYPHDEFTVLAVEASGDIDEVFERECQWIRRVAAMVPGLAPFRLFIQAK